jgi:hypothetical protein
MFVDGRRWSSWQHVSQNKTSSALFLLISWTLSQNSYSSSRWYYFVDLKSKDEGRQLLIEFILELTNTYNMNSDLKIFDTSVSSIWFVGCVLIVALSQEISSGKEFGLPLVITDMSLQALEVWDIFTALMVAHVHFSKGQKVKAVYLPDYNRERGTFIPAMVI